MPLHAENTSELIKLRDVTVSFGSKAILNNINFTVRDKEFIAITGPNGGGKTTLLRVMLKLLKPVCGSVEYFDNGKPTNKLRIGYLPQKSMIDTNFPITVRQTVKSGLLSGWKNSKNKKLENDSKFEQIVELMGIGDYLDHRIGTLSGGQLQRTLFGRALISDPSILMLDEPLSYVDKTFEHQIYSIMEDLTKKTTIVLVSHEMSFISGMASRHIIVDHGVHECNAPHHYIDTGCE